MTQWRPAADRRGIEFPKLAAPEATAFLAPSLVLWRRFMTALVVIAILHTLLGRHLRGLTELFFYVQDLPVVGLMLLLTGGLYLARPAWAPARPLAPTWRTAGLIALAVVAFAWAGTFLIYDNFALSMDEFLARFDAQIIAGGHLAAPVPAAWRAYVPALQPMFMLDVPGHAYWVSNYLPVNAAFLALASKLGADSLMPPLWAGLAVLATYGVARRLWPEKPGAALAAALLLATSPQLLITAMTPYAMSAHLGLNMVWLWLVLRGGRLGHGAAAGVAFLATGLHQLVFHPLFAAPFVLEMWLAKRWNVALWHTCAYTVIGLFWALYPALLLKSLGASSVGSAAQAHGALATVTMLLSAFDPAGIGMVAKNLVRFLTWQTLLAAPLALIAAAPAFRAGGMLRGLAVSVVLTTVAMLVLLPYQGHGWGYRYLHGLMGSVCLLAAWGWSRLAPSASAAARADTRRAVFAAAATASVLILLPLRAWQTHAFEHPYAVAERQIQSIGADVVLVDGANMPFGSDLVRNDPFLRNRPIILEAASVSTRQMGELGERAEVRWFWPTETSWASTGQSSGRNENRMSASQPQSSRSPR